MMDDTDEGLVARIQKGDHRAFSLLVARHTDRFYGLAWRLLGNEAEAGDVVQDAFLKLWARPGLFRLEAGARFTTWFYRVVSNLAMDRLRRDAKWKASDVLEFIPDHRPGADTTLETKEMSILLEAAIAGLPERQKLALNLCYYEGLSMKEAAEIMSVGEKAVESLLTRARAGLKDDFSRHGLLDAGEVRDARYAKTQ